MNNRIDANLKNNFSSLSSNTIPSQTNNEEHDEDESSIWSPNQPTDHEQMFSDHHQPSSSINPSIKKKVSSDEKNFSARVNLNNHTQAQHDRNTNAPQIQNKSPFDDEKIKIEEPKNTMQKKNSPQITLSPTIQPEKGNPPIFQIQNEISPPPTDLNNDQPKPTSETIQNKISSTTLKLDEHKLAVNETNFPIFQIQNELSPQIQKFDNDLNLRSPKAELTTKKMESTIIPSSNKDNSSLTKKLLMKKDPTKMMEVEKEITFVPNPLQNVTTTTGGEESFTSHHPQPKLKVFCCFSKKKIRERSHKYFCFFFSL